MPSLLRRLTAWLCLATALLTGLPPAQGFVLCLEADGCVSVDLAAPSEHCSCCESHEQAAAAPVQDARVLGEAGCACVDLVVLGVAQVRSGQIRPIGPQLEFAPAPAPVDALPVPVLVPPASRSARAEVPRPPGSLALIRSVILLL